MKYVAIVKDASFITLSTNQYRGGSLKLKDAKADVKRVKAEMEVLEKMIPLAQAIDRTGAAFRETKAHADNERWILTWNELLNLMTEAKKMVGLKSWSIAVSDQGRHRAKLAIRALELAMLELSANGPVQGACAEQ